MACQTATQTIPNVLPSLQQLDSIWQSILLVNGVPKAGAKQALESTWIQIDYSKLCAEWQDSMTCKTNDAENGHHACDQLQATVSFIWDQAA